MTQQHVQAQPPVEVTGGVDTHKDTHTAAALDQVGRELGCRQFPAGPAGYQQLHDWLRRFGPVTAVGVEGTGSYGAGLARHLHATGVTVVEVDRPDRKTRRFHGKSDPVDARAAARAVLAGTATGTPKTGDGPREALRALRVAHRAAVSHRADLQRRLQDLLVTAPAPLRETLRRLTPHALVTACAAQTPDPATARAGDPTAATRVALHQIACLHQRISIDVKALTGHIKALVKTINPGLLAVHGVGPDTAGALLVAAGDNPERLHSEAAFAMLCGAAPIPASSGKTSRHRLNRGGNRQANAALWRIVITRLATDQRTRDYRDRRITQGRTPTETIRCLKRYIAREIYQHLQTPQTTPEPTPTTG